MNGILVRVDQHTTYQRMRSKSLRLYPTPILALLFARSGWFTCWSSNAICLLLIAYCHSDNGKSYHLKREGHLTYRAEGGAITGGEVARYFTHAGRRWIPSIAAACRIRASAAVSKLIG